MLNHGEDDITNVGLFSVLDGATVKKLRIENAQLEKGASSNQIGRIKYYVGMLAGQIIDSDISEIEVYGAIDSDGESLGLLAGKITNKDEEMYLNKISCNGFVDSNFTKNAGGIIGEVDGTIRISNSSVVTNFKNSNNKPYVGGLVGKGRISSVSDSYVFPQFDINSVNSNIDMLSGSYKEYVMENINNITTLDTEYSNTSSIKKYQPKNNEKVNLVSSIEVTKNKSLSELGLNSDNWEYLDGNIYPTIKGLPYYYASDIELQSESMQLNVGESKKIIANIKPENTSIKKLSYKSDIPNTATVDNNGIVKGNFYVGTATITISTMDGSNISKQIEVTVGDKIEPYKICTYDCDEEKKFINNILPTTIEHYKELVNIQEPYVVKVFNKDGTETKLDDSIATEMITRIYIDDKVVGEYTNIVPGDIYADGKISTRDAARAQQYLVGIEEVINKEMVKESPKWYAADFSRDGKIRLNDVELIKKYIVGEYKLNEEEYYGKDN